MDLASDAVALGQGGRSIPFGVSPDTLSEELLGLIGPLRVLVSAGANHESDDNRQRALSDDHTRSAQGKRGPRNRHNPDSTRCNRWEPFESDPATEPCHGHEDDRDRGNGGEGPT